MAVNSFADSFAGAPHPYARLRAAMAPDPSRWYYTGVWRDTGAYGNSHCACGHEIRYEFLIACMDDPRTLVIGSTCIETNVPALIRDGARELADDLQEANRGFKRELRANKREIEADEAIPELLSDFRRLRSWCFDRRAELRRRRVYMPEVFYWVEQPPDHHHETQSAFAAAIRRRYVSVWLKGAQAVSDFSADLADAEPLPVPRQARLFKQLTTNLTRLADDWSATNHDGALLALAELPAFRPIEEARAAEPAEPTAERASEPTWLEGRLAELEETGIEAWAQELLATMLADDPRVASVWEVIGMQEENGSFTAAFLLRPPAATGESSPGDWDDEEQWRRAEAVHAALCDAWPTHVAGLAPDRRPCPIHYWDDYVAEFDEAPLACLVWWPEVAEEEDAELSPEDDGAQAAEQRDEPEDEEAQAEPIAEEAPPVVADEASVGAEEASEPAPEPHPPSAGEDPDAMPGVSATDEPVGGRFSRWLRRVARS